ncbi:hypothetical protein A6J39_002305 [Legionella anisa]|uniref:Uncharacterized protein n=1 Tax=Legionella anisa TaxID=28082 RepID=A0AAX0WSL6_9GAMM|nr:hypothetical protein DLD14_03710 [Legionella anisa]PNL60136.1 hypothetical protein A6J39_002305 [Legionella anisa]
MRFLFIIKRQDEAKYNETRGNIGGCLHFASLSQNGLIFEYRSAAYIRYVSSGAQKIRTVWPR